MQSTGKEAGQAGRKQEAGLLGKNLDLSESQVPVLRMDDKGLHTVI